MVTATEDTAAIDTMLSLIADVRAGRHRDPLGALCDRLLDWRAAIEAAG